MLSTKHTTLSLIAGILAMSHIACDSSGNDDSNALGSGTIVLGSNSYYFDVVACDLSGDYDDIYHTITGQGSLEDGE